ncbi:MAG: aldo/keto reductase [Ruminococcaceae bacterium]|nr:aldo/keto reductase [Oscillospiraceae bacterium]
MYPLGNTGLNISRVGFGGIPIQRTEENKIPALFDALLREGINFIDTARGYTVSEAYIGRAIAGKRDKFVLATKSMARTAQAMAADIDRSLANLQTDYIDLYQIHNPNMADLETVLAPGGAMEALIAAKKSGKIGHIGLTCHLLSVFERALSIPQVETIMFPYNLVETQGEALIQKCREKGIGFIAMKPLAGGAIENASLAMRFILQNPAVSVVIPGMYSPEEVEINAHAAGELTEADYVEIQNIRNTLGTAFCRRCNYCAPCTVGINISGVFLFEGYLERYHLGNWAKDRYSAMAKKASDCIGCGVCESRCPYGLPIREMLKKAASSFGE